VIKRPGKDTRVILLEVLEERTPTRQSREGLERPGLTVAHGAGHSPIIAGGKEAV
jgi:hypothetical protein